MTPKRSLLMAKTNAERCAENYRRNRERRIKWQKEYNRKHKDAQSKYREQWRKKNKERVAAINRRSYQKWNQKRKAKHISLPSLP